MTTVVARLVALPERRPQLGTMRDSWPDLDADFLAPLGDDDLADWES